MPPQNCDHSLGNNTANLIGLLKKMLKLTYFSPTIHKFIAKSCAFNIIIARFTAKRKPQFMSQHDIRAPDKMRECVIKH